MHILADKLALFGLCVLAMLFSDAGWVYIIAMLVAVAASSLNSYFENILVVYISFLYIAVCFLAPAFALFLPLIAYDLAGRDKYALRLAWCAALPMCFAAGGWHIMAFTALSCIIAYFFEHKNTFGLKRQSAFYALQDKAQENVEIYKRKEHELAERQEYEIKFATLAERNRIAREIHDNVGHLLTRSILQIEAMGISYKNGLIRDDLGQIKKSLTDAMDSIRASVHGLYDESINLKLQLEMIIDGFKYCPVTLRYDSGEMPVELRICFLAITREALVNITRHSKADKADITITEHPAFYQLTVSDNGSATPAKPTAGMGLQNMSDRISAFGGIFRAGHNKGFKIFASVPKAADANLSSTDLRMANFAGKGAQA